MKHIKFGIIFVTVILLFTLALSTLADFGDTNDYSGGDSSFDFDFGDSDYDSDSDINFGGFFGDNDDDDDNNGDDYDDDDSSAGLGVIVVIAIIVIVVVYIAKKSKTAPGNVTYTAPVNTASFQSNTGTIEAEIKKTDPNFSAEMFTAFAKNTYISLQYAWMEGDLEKIRLLVGNDLFTQSKLSIEQHNKAGRKNIMERINVTNSYLTDYNVDKTTEHLKMFMSVKLVDYIIDVKTEKVLAGKKDILVTMNYALTFTRGGGSKTNDDGGVKTTNCPNCGAPTEITSSGKCRYCGSLITNSKYSWVLSEIKKA